MVNEEYGRDVAASDKDPARLNTTAQIYGFEVFQSVNHLEAN